MPVEKIATIQIRDALESYRSDPAIAALLTEPFIRRMEVFSQELALWGNKTNLTARPQDVGETVFHVLDSLAPLVLLSDAFGLGKRILDFGSGAGFPGLVLASACPARFTLAEARQKRISFLKVTVAEMDLDNVEILAARLDTSALAPVFDLALSCASGPAAEFYEIAVAALHPDGLAALFSTPSQRLDLKAARLAGLGNYRRYGYTVKRDGGTVERILSVWSAAKKV
jgi:16S rRNA (guanine527-N7)-methyltransferase